MKPALVLALASVLLAACSTSPRYAYRDRAYSPVYAPSASGQRAGHEEVICHKGKKTMTLPSSAVDAHLGHGDRRGPC
jgi:hypothetical protein